MQLMRWAIRRLVSRGKSQERPWAVRDSETIQDTTAQKAWDQPLTPPHRKPPRQAGQRWHHVRPPRRRCPGRHTCEPQPREKHQQPSGKSWRDEKCGARTRPRSPKPQRNWTHPGNPDISRTTTRARWEIKAGVGTSRVMGPWREKEAQLLQLRGDRGEFGHRGAHHITDSVVPQNLVAAATTREGMVSPAVRHFTTQGARGVVIPKGHTKAALESSTKEVRGDIGVRDEGLAVTQAPARGTRQASRWRRRRVGKDTRHRLGLNLGRQGLLRRRNTLSIDVGRRTEQRYEGRTQRRKGGTRHQDRGGRTSLDKQKSWPHKLLGHAQQQTGPRAHQLRHQGKPSGAPNQMTNGTECRGQQHRGLADGHREEQCGTSRGPWTNRSKSGANRKHPEHPETCRWRSKESWPCRRAGQAGPHTSPRTPEELQEA